MLTYCVKQRKKTECVPGSETFLVTKNGRNAMKCQCAECGITKFRFLSKREGGSFDELIVKGLAAGTVIICASYALPVTLAACGPSCLAVFCM